MTQILIADDHEVVRQGVRVLLEANPDWTVCGEAATGREAVAKATEFHPDVVVLDIAMPEVNGLAACRAIKAARPTVGIVLASAFDDAAFQQEAEAAGAAAFVVKSSAAEDLEAAVWQAFRGGTPFRVYSRRSPG